jgi:uncharacterized protein (TIGR03032 family)
MAVRERVGLFDMTSIGKIRVEGRDACGLLNHLCANEVDVAAGRFEEVAFCPGYARGLAFHGDYAVIGTSLPRDNRTFTGLALDGELERRGAEPRCAVLVIDLRSGDTVHWLRFDGVVKELYDVGVLPGVARPAAIGFKSDEIRRVITIGEGPGA